MNQAARKIPQLSLMPSESTSGESARDSAASLQEFFGGWLDSIAPELSREASRKSRSHGLRYRQRPISTTDIVRVNRATIRESTAPRHWPPDVVAQFLTAEVITRKNKRS